jgi:hypothetical protein
MGSGMGTLLEGLWLFSVNRELAHRFDSLWELAWLPDHEYNDFALLSTGGAWDRGTRGGEVLRVEAKSMVLGADESKAHFDAPAVHIGEHDQLLVLLWSWERNGDRVQPVIVDWFLGAARDVAAVRDALHIARGGSFVDGARCPDGCSPQTCRHHGEPLNASGKRERVSGPESCRVSANTSFAANFGGMVRMLKTNNDAARAALRRVCASNATARRYVAFVWRHLPNEELSQFSIAEWRACASRHGIPTAGLGKVELASAVRAQVPNCQEEMLGLAAEG